MKAEVTVQECASAYQAYLDAEIQLGIIQKELQEKNRLALEMVAAKGDLATTNSRLTLLRQDLQEAQDAQEEIKVLTPLVEQQDTLTKQAQELDVELRLAETDRIQIKRETDRLEALRKQFANAQIMIDKGTALASKIVEETTKSEELQAQEDAVRQKGLETKAEIERLEKQLESLSGEVNQCPVCGTELTQDHVNNLKSIAEASLIVQRACKEASLSDWTRIHNQSKDLQAHINMQRRDLAAYQAIDLSAISDEIAKQEEHVISLGFPRDLTEIQQTLETVNATFIALNNPRTRMAVAQNKTHRYEEIRRCIIEEEGHIAQNTTKLAHLQDESACYATLETRQRNIEDVRANTLNAHNRYANHFFEAQQLHDRKEVLVQRQREVQEKEVQIAESQEVRGILVALYDVEEYRILSSTIHEMELGISSMSARVDLNRRILETQAQDIAKMRQKLMELDRSVHIHERLCITLTRLSFIRQSLRDAGPAITEAIVASVSVMASRLFADITQDPSAELVWDESFDVLVTTDNQTRHFNQLSGGEQMAAALSVRLALLKEISSIDLGAFDEPTVNLDTQRRISLSEQIVNVKGFTQLFVISHDDSFESYADNIVRIEKINGESVVIS
jgi:exonuclease SbcC